MIPCFFPTFLPLATLRWHNAKKVVDQPSLNLKLWWELNGCLTRLYCSTRGNGIPIIYCLRWQGTMPPETIPTARSMRPYSFFNFQDTDLQPLKRRKKSAWTFRSYRRRSRQLDHLHRTKEKPHVNIWMLQNLCRFNISPEGNLRIFLSMKFSETSDSITTRSFLKKLQEKIRRFPENSYFKWGKLATSEGIYVLL